MPSSFSKALPFTVTQPEPGLTDIVSSGLGFWRGARFAGVLLTFAGPIIAIVGFDRASDVYWAERFSDLFWFGFQATTAGLILYAVGYRLGLDHLCQINMNAGELSLWRTRGRSSKKRYSCSISEVTKIDIQVLGDGKQRRSIVSVFLRNGNTRQISPDKIFEFEHAEAFCQAAQRAMTVDR